MLLKSEVVWGNHLLLCAFKVISTTEPTVTQYLYNIKSINNNKYKISNYQEVRKTFLFMQNSQGFIFLFR